MLTRTRLLWQSLRFHAWSNLAVLLGCAIGASVLTGALLVGDSMRGSLRQMTLNRLGKIDCISIGPNFFQADLAKRIEQSQAEGKKFSIVAPAILVQGVVKKRGDTIGYDVNVIGTSPEFFQLFPKTGDAKKLANQVVVNRTLAHDMGLPRKLEKPVDLIISFENSSSIPQDAYMGKRDEPPKALSASLASILPTPGAGNFSLDASQRQPRNIYVPREQLANTLEQPGRCNALLLSMDSNQTVPADKQVRDQWTKDLGRQMAGEVSLEDLGLSLRLAPQGAEAEGVKPPKNSTAGDDSKKKEQNIAVLESRELILNNQTLNAAIAAAKESQFPYTPAMTYLADKMTVGDRSLYYSIITATQVDAKKPLGPIPHTEKSQPLEGEGIYLNQWAADQLKATLGDKLSMSFLAVNAQGDLTTKTANFLVQGVVPMTGLALDRSFTPEYPGLTDAEDFGNWEPPFPIDTNKVTDEDEKYWDDFRTAPKAYIALKTGQTLFGSKYGNTTSLRVGLTGNQSAQKQLQQFQQSLRKQIQSRALGLNVQAIKQESLQASNGSTDFSGLFIGFSFFLIVSAGLLVGLMFRLNIDRRASQIGLMLATGFRRRQVSATLLSEGLAIASLGSLLGLVGGIFYAQWMIAGLTTRWKAAVNTPFIEFHWTPMSLILGWVLSVVVAGLAMGWALRSLVRLAVPTLLQPGESQMPSSGEKSRLQKSMPYLAVGLFIIGILFLVSAPAMGAAGAFFGGGWMILMAGLAGLASWSGRQGDRFAVGSAWAGLASLAQRNIRRSPSRTLLTTALIAFATFMVVAVGAFREQAGPDVPMKTSGNGGFRFIGTTRVPLPRNLASAEARLDLLANNVDAVDEILKKASKNDDSNQEKSSLSSAVYSFQVKPGDDASCLNIYQPKQPEILGASDRFLARGGFAFSRLDESLEPTEQERANPWLLLKRDLPDGAVPVIGDANALQWILKQSVGSTFSIPTPSGADRPLRVVASLSSSIFQSQLVMSDPSFDELFPYQAGFSYFVFDVPKDDQKEFIAQMQEGLADYGFSAVTTFARIAQYQAVANTYISTFQLLGGLGLVLGTFGLGMVMMRNVWERRGELGLMRAVGFPQSRLNVMVMLENVILLLLGLILGTVCAIVAIMPQLLDRGAGDVLGLAGILLLVFVVGVASGVVSVVAAARVPVLTALRSE